MTLDILYKTIKDAKYPILNRLELVDAIGDKKIEFEGDIYDARDIGTMIMRYPIRRASQLIELFISAASEEYSDYTIAREFEDFGKFEA